MNKPFNIHDWQAKRRLTENDEWQKRQDALTPGKNPSAFFGDDSLMSKMRSQESMSNADIRSLQVVVGDYSLNKVLNTIAVIADKIGKHDEADMIKKLATQIQDFNDPRTDPEIRSDFDDPVLEHTVTFTKDDMATLHNDGELVKADDDGKDHTYVFGGDLDEQNMTGTGTSFNKGTGMGHFGRKNKKTKVPRYKGVNEQEEDPYNKDTKTISGLANLFLDYSKRLRKGEFKGLQGAEIDEIDDLVGLVLQGAMEGNITSIIKRLEKIATKTIKSEI